MKSSHPHMYSLWSQKAWFLVSLLSLVIFCGGHSEDTDGTSDLPNILLISLDTCRGDHLSSYGYQRQTSPFIDELAARGIRFENAFINTLGTPPSHTTILSSLYQETHQVDYAHDGKGVQPVPKGVEMFQEILHKNGYITLAVTDGGYMSKHYGFNRGFDIYDDDHEGALFRSKKLVDLIQSVRQNEHEKEPIFAFLHTYEIHSPYAPPEAYKDIFGRFESSFSPTDKNLLKFWNRAKDLKKEDLEFLVARYDAEIRYTDDTLKNMFAELEKTGFFENALVILTSDHGEEFGDHGCLSHLGFLYEELLRIPLIIFGTNVPSGRVDERMASSIDIAPTVLAYAGIALPEKMEGVDLLADAPPDSEAGVFSQYGKKRYSIRTARWKLIEETESSRLQLFDLENDPHEKNNIAEIEPQVLSKLHQRLRLWRTNQRSLITKVKNPEMTKIPEKELSQLRALGYVK